MRQLLVTATLVAALLTPAGPLGAMERPHSTFTVPWFEVGPVTSVPGGTTTVFAVTNVGGSAATVDITYYNVIGTELEFESVALEPNQTFSRNVPDLLPPPPGGVIRGYIEIASDAWVTVDYFQYGPGSGFVVGDRPLATFSEGSCHEVQVRFLNGEPGGGGGGLVLTTDFIFYFDGKTRKERAYRIDFYDEAGNLLESLSRPGPRQRVRRFEMDSFSVSEPFGTMRVHFPDGGAVISRVAVPGLYSVSIKGVCLD